MWAWEGVVWAMASNIEEPDRSDEETPSGPSVPSLPHATKMSVLCAPLIPAPCHALRVPYCHRLIFSSGTGPVDLCPPPWPLPFPGCSPCFSCIFSLYPVGLPRGKAVFGDLVGGTAWGKAVFGDLGGLWEQCLAEGLLVTALQFLSYSGVG